MPTFTIKRAKEHLEHLELLARQLPAADLPLAPLRDEFRAGIAADEAAIAAKAKAAKAASAAPAKDEK